MHVGDYFRCSCLYFTRKCFRKCEYCRIRDNSSGNKELDVYITKRMEDTEDEFLMYNEADIDNAINITKGVLDLLIKLKNRDFSTAKFKDEFYFKK